MLKVSEIVKDILSSSDIELEAMRAGILNLSAYAAKIQPEVEKRCWKPVQKTTIVVALSRLQVGVAKIAPLKPVIKFTELSVKSPLAEITFEKTLHSIQQSRTLSSFLQKHEPAFLTITQGINEITVIVSQEQELRVIKHFATPPKASFVNLVGVTVSFSEKYLREPNVIYTVLSALAGQRVNIIEIVSTYTELSVIIDQKQLELCITTLNQFFPAPQKNLQEDNIQ